MSVFTAGSNPTLSAGYKIPPRQLRLHLLPDLIVLVVGLSKCNGSATEIAQCPLGDLDLFTTSNFTLLEIPGQALVGRYQQIFDLHSAISLISVKQVYVLKLIQWLLFTFGTKVTVIHANNQSVTAQEIHTNAVGQGINMRTVMALSGRACRM